MSRVKQKQSLSRISLRGYGSTTLGERTAAVRWTRFATADGIRLGVAVDDGGTLVDLTGTELAGTAIGGGDPLLDLLRAGVPLGTADLDGRPRHSTDDVHVLAPVERPGKIIAIGLNYVDHANETGMTLPTEPLTFAKYPTSVTGPYDDVVVPWAVTQKVDWEAELALVVGTTCGPGRRGTLADVAGWTVANDVSARDLQFRDNQWTRGKSLDTFCPLGPSLVTTDEVDDPQALDVTAEVNGVLMQKAPTSDMVFDVATLMDFLTATVTLEPGDVVLTGTPPGVGAFREPPVLLADGDVVEVAVSRIGRLRNTVRVVR
jgi:2-keto-4-pentenoate hydratase/2-oxohepta-3-ene-1,7-dioic acid hydratase in catechol pathway